MPGQKVENLFALALETPLEEREQSENLNVGFQALDRTWEFIVKYSTDLKGVQEAFPEIITEELIAGYGILTVPENLVRQVLSRTEIEYAEIPKKLFFADFQARAASCILEVTKRYPELTGEGVVVAVIEFSGERVIIIADYIAEMLSLESGPYFYIEYAGVTSTGGTEYYEFRCYRA